MVGYIALSLQSIDPHLKIDTKLASRALGNGFVKWQLANLSE